MRFLLLLLMLCIPLIAEESDNPFASDEIIESIEDTAVAEVIIDSTATEEAKLPFWYGYIRWQKKVNFKLSALINSLKHQLSLGKILMILLISFLYSILHTAGPGHGKVILGTYFLTSTEQHKSKDAVKAGLIVSLTHVGSALVLSLFVMLVLRSVTAGAQDSELTEKAKFFGGSMVMVTGILIVATSFFHNQMENLEAKIATIGPKNKSLIWYSILSGIVPCPLALLVLSFAVAANVYIVGLLSALVMAIGAALTVGSIGFLAIRGREFIDKVFKINRIKNISMILRGIAGLLLCFFGFVMMDMLTLQ